ncbi:MAG: acyl carrier protein [Proteobacteria bacterium]|nr:acyl carrier protein [Pseudomonadota bacterium]
MELETGIREIIVKEFAVDEKEVLSEAHLQFDLGGDSLGLLNLAEAIGKRYDIEIEGDDLVDLANVGELVKLVESKISSKS